MIIYNRKLLLPAKLKPNCIWQETPPDVDIDLNAKRILPYPLAKCVTKVNNCLCFRIWLPYMFQAKAQEKYQDARRQDADSTDEQRDDLFIKFKDQEDMPVLKRSIQDEILKEVVGKNPQKWYTKDRDKNFMQEFLENNSEQGLPKTPNVVKYIPGGIPLIYYLLAEGEAQPDGYQYPSQVYLHELSKIPSLDINTSLGVTVYEITLCENPCEMTPSQFIKQVKDRIAEDRKRFPARFLSLDIEEMTFPLERMEDLKKAARNWDRKKESVNYKLPIPRDKKASNIPARIIFGNGQTWLASIRFNWIIQTNMTTGKDEYCLSPESFPKELLDFTQYCSLLVGQNITEDMRKLEKFVKEVFGIEIRSPLCLEMSSVLMALGWKLPLHNLFYVNLVTMGGLLNKAVSCADQKWCLPWTELDRAFRIYCIGDVRFGHSNFVVLMSLLIRNLFPDIDALCEALQLNQPQAIDWITWFLGRALTSTDVHQQRFKEAKTREDLLCSLVPHGGGEPREPRDGYYRYYIGPLLPTWPNVIHGGPKSLQDVLPFFAKQMEIIFKNQRVKIAHPDLVVNFPVFTKEIFMKMTYGKGNTSTTIQKGTDTPFMGKRDGYGPMFQLDPHHISIDDVSREIARTGQGLVQGILEQARNCSKFRSALLWKLNTAAVDYKSPKYSFWLERTALYERLRNMQYFLTDHYVHYSTQHEIEMDRKIENVAKQEGRAIERSKSILKNREKRIDLIKTNKARSAGRIQKKTGLHQRVYSKIPGDFTARNNKVYVSRKQRLERIKEENPGFVSKKQWRKKTTAERKAESCVKPKDKVDVKDLREIVDKKMAADPKWGENNPDATNNTSYRSMPTKSRESRAEERYPERVVRYSPPPSHRYSQDVPQETIVRPIRFHGDTDDDQPPQRIMTVTRDWESPERKVEIYDWPERTVEIEYSPERTAPSSHYFQIDEDYSSRRNFSDRPSDYLPSTYTSQTIENEIPQGTISGWQVREAWRYRRDDSPVRQGRGSRSAARQESLSTDRDHYDAWCENNDPYPEDVDFVNAQMQSHGFKVRKGKSGFNRFTM